MAPPARSEAPPAARDQTTGTFFYDGDCGLCAAAVAWLRRHADPSVHYMAAEPEALARHGVSEADAAGAVVLVHAGHQCHGAEAIGRVMRRGPGWMDRPIGCALLTWPVRPFARGVYALVARNRHRLSRGPRVCGAARS